jgi:hypothetical protein
MRSRTHLRRNSPRSDLVKRNEGDSFPQVTLLQQVAADFLVLHDDVEETTTSDDFQCSSFVVVLFREIDELSSEPFDIPPVESRGWVAILEAEPPKRLLHSIPTLKEIANMRYGYGFSKNK